MAFLKIQQGDSYPIPIVIKQGDTVITASMVTGVRIGIGKYMAYYPDGALTYDGGVWYFPFTQKMSYDVGTGDVDIQVQCAFADGSVLGSSVEKVKVKESLFQKAWNAETLTEQEGESENDLTPVTLTAGAGLIIQLGNIPQIVVMTGVESVNGKTGTVVLTPSDLGIDLSQYVPKNASNENINIDASNGDINLSAASGNIELQAYDSADATVFVTGSNIALTTDGGEISIGNGETSYPMGISVNGNKIHGVDTPAADTDAANKGYVDNIVGSFNTENDYASSVINYESGRFLYPAGTRNNSTSYFRSDYIPIKAGDKIELVTTIGTSYCAYVLYDTNKNVIYTRQGSGTQDYKYNHTITNDGYIRVSGQTAYVNSSSLNVLIFGAYGMATLNPLNGKKISFNGDSICYGAGYLGGYGKIIGTRNGMTVENRAVSGATIATNTYDGGDARHWISSDIANMDATADYAIIEGGVNDSSLLVAKGSLSSGFNATLDTTTFYGACEYMFRELTTRFAGKKIGYIMVHACRNGFAYLGASNNYYYIVLECAKKWGVPVLDLQFEVPPLGLFEADSPCYPLTQAYTRNADGTHLNKAGYEKLYCDKIESWLRSL